ncbi:universal stress protein [Halopiger thermotolerans]
MLELVVPIDEDGVAARRIVEGIGELHFDPGATKLTLLTVFEEFEVDSKAWLTITSDEFYEETEIPQPVAKAAADLSDRGYEVDVRREHGDPSAEIVRIAGEHDVDAIVISGRQRSPVGKALLGSVTQSVLLHADRPVIVIPQERARER